MENWEACGEVRGGVGRRSRRPRRRLGRQQPAVGSARAAQVDRSAWRVSRVGSRLLGWFSSSLGACYLSKSCSSWFDRSAAGPAPILPQEQASCRPGRQTSSSGSRYALQLPAPPRPCSLGALCSWQRLPVSLARHALSGLRPSRTPSRSCRTDRTVCYRSVCAACLAACRARDGQGYVPA